MPLGGQRVSAAYLSTVNLSFEVRSGLVIRQMHHWAADVFVGAIAVHMCRIFFTGAFRKPRELNWIIGVTLLILAIVNGFLGYSLPDDLVSGTGLRIMYSIVLSIPLVGCYLASFLFGGNFPGDGTIIPRLFIIHVLILPAIIPALIGAHLGLLVRQKHTQFPGKGRTEKNVVGSPMYPTFIAKTNGFLFVITGVLWPPSAGLAQINPIWQFGQYEPVQDQLRRPARLVHGLARRRPAHHAATGSSSAGATPSRSRSSSRPCSSRASCFNLFYVWPFVEAKVTGDRAEHNLLDRPRDKPRRTAIGAGVLTFFFTLFAASSTDVLANFFKISLNEVLWFFRFAVFIVPAAAGVFAYYLCREMSGVPGIGRRKRAVVITRSAQGEYESVSTEPRPGDGEVELAPVPVPGRIDLNGEVEPVEAASSGVRRIPRR